jgi:DNA ligase-1
MCEAVEQQDRTTEKIRIIDESLSSFTNPQLVLDILSLNIDSNNIGNKRAVTWIANSLQMFEDEVKTQTSMWGDVGEGIHMFLDGEWNSDSNYTIRNLYSFLTLDCSSINSNSYVMVSEALNTMSALEVKWFIRYWLRHPRNGIGKKAVASLLKRRFGTQFREEYLKIHSTSEVYRYLSNGNTPPTHAGIGKYIQCSLAKKFKTPFTTPENYIIDYKYDGNRYQIHRDRDSVIIFNRKGKVVTRQYPDVVEVVKTFNATTCILDTEIFPVERRGRTEPAEHKKLATRVHSKDIETAVESCPVHLVIFDILYYMGQSLIEHTYSERMVHMPDFPSINRAVSFMDKDIERAYNMAINEGFEGVMIKDLDSTYQAGRRTSAMLKHKPPRIELDVVITSAKYGEGKRSSVFGTYGLSVKDDSSLTGYTFIGSVGTGLSDGDLMFLTTQLKKIIEKFSSDVFYVLPRIVLEVTCDLISKDSEGNYGLRFPRVMRIRNDKFAKDCNSILDIQLMS